MPRDLDGSMPICGPNKNECVDESIETVEKAGYDTEGPVSECNCLPACNDMKFPTYTTSSKINKAGLLKTSNALKTKVPGIKNNSYIKENIAILHVYHQELHFLKHERGQVCLALLNTLFRVDCEKDLFLFATLYAPILESILYIEKKSYLCHCVVLHIGCSGLDSWLKINDSIFMD